MNTNAENPAQTETTVSTVAEVVTTAKEQSNNLDFLQAEIDNLAANAKNVKVQDLTFGVYSMTIIEMGEHKTQKQESMLKVVIDTGFLTKKNEPRTFNLFFWYNGVYPDGSQRNEQLIQFFKRVTGKDTIKKIADFKDMLHCKLSVATKKDASGHIAYWYAGSIKDLTRMKDTYRVKDESNGKTPEIAKAEPTTQNIDSVTVVQNNDDVPF